MNGKLVGWNGLYLGVKRRTFKAPAQPGPVRLFVGAYDAWGRRWVAYDEITVNVRATP